MALSEMDPSHLILDQVLPQLSFFQSLKRVLLSALQNLVGRQNKALSETDAAVWSKLPSDLIFDQILPQLSFFQSLSVYRYWNLLFFTKSCITKHRQSMPSTSFLVVSEYTGEEELIGHKMLLYNHFTDIWQRFARQPFVPQHEKYEKYVPVASAGGLVCCLRKAPPQLEICICNPVLNEWVDLPILTSNSLGEYWYPHCSMSTNEEDHSLIILVKFGHKAPFVYHSTFQCWIEIPIPTHHSRYRYHCGGLLGSIVYLLTYDHLLKYDVVQQHMLEPVALPRRQPLYPWVFELNDKPVLIGIVNENMGKMKGLMLCFWIFDVNVMGWSSLVCSEGPPYTKGKYKKMPYRIHQDRDWFYCQAHSSDAFDAFDVKHNQWRRLPDKKITPYKTFNFKPTTFTVVDCHPFKT